MALPATSRDLRLEDATKCCQNVVVMLKYYYGVVHNVKTHGYHVDGSGFESGFAISVQTYSIAI
jgi:hypothetical protein